MARFHLTIPGQLAFIFHYAHLQMKPLVRVVQDGFPSEPALDTAVSRALLIRTSESTVAETFRIHVPGRIVAFGKRDKLSPGYNAAVAAARAAGFFPVERLVGGRAAVFHEGVLAFSWSIPAVNPGTGIQSRFGVLAEMMVNAFSKLGVSSAIGDLPGEYCPGTFSIHCGPIKVMGVGQRLARHAAHVGGLVVVSGSHLLRETLVPIYRTLGIAWDPATAGSLQDISSGVTLDTTTHAILGALADLRTIEISTLTNEIVSLARQLAPEHIPNVCTGTT